MTSIPFRRRRLRRRKGAYTLDIVDGPNEVREAYRALRASLILGDLDHPIRSLLVTSAREREGKTTIAANVALSLAQAGERVVVVDCDLRTPALHERFGIANDVGLSTLLTSPSTPCDALQQVQVDGTRFAVLPAGPPPPDPADLFLGVHAAQVISALTERFRYVVLDCPPILSFADAMTLPWLVDGVLFVARAGKTKAVDVKHAELRLRQVSAPLLGAVLLGPRADRAAVPSDLDAPESWSYRAPNGASVERLVARAVIRRPGWTSSFSMSEGHVMLPVSTRADGASPTASGRVTPRRVAFFFLLLFAASVPLEAIAHLGPLGSTARIAGIAAAASGAVRVVHGPSSASGE